MKIIVGTPPQSILVGVDSGIVGLSLIPISINQGYASVYDPNESSSALMVEGYTGYQ